MNWPRRVVQEKRSFYAITYATKIQQHPTWVVHVTAESFEEALEAAKLYLRQNQDRFERILQLLVNHGVEIMRIEEGLLS